MVAWVQPNVETGGPGHHRARERLQSLVTLDLQYVCSRATRAPRRAPRRRARRPYSRRTRSALPRARRPFPLGRCVRLGGSTPPFRLLRCCSKLTDEHLAIANNCKSLRAPASVRAPPRDPLPRVPNSRASDPSLVRECDKDGPEHHRDREQLQEPGEAQRRVRVAARRPLPLRISRASDPLVGVPPADGPEHHRDREQLQGLKELNVSVAARRPATPPFRPPIPRRVRPLSRQVLLRADAAAQGALHIPTLERSTPTSATSPSPGHRRQGLDAMRRYYAELRRRRPRPSRSRRADGPGVGKTGLLAACTTPTPRSRRRGTHHRPRDDRGLPRPENDPKLKLLMCGGTGPATALLSLSRARARFPPRAPSPPSLTPSRRVLLPLPPDRPPPPLPLSATTLASPSTSRSTSSSSRPARSASSSSTSRATSTTASTSSSSSSASFDEHAARRDDGRRRAPRPGRGRRRRGGPARP